MALKQKVEETSSDSKKRKRVVFAKIDSGVGANECIKVFLVRSQDEVGATSSICIEPVDLNHFFGEDGKIYGYKDLKINIWLSTISFHAYAEISFESTQDGGKGITDLKPALQSIFGESLIEKEEFLQTFSKECDYIRNIVSHGTVIDCDTFNGGHPSDTHLDAEGFTVEVIRMEMQSMPVGVLYSRLVPLVLLLVEGGRPIDITDPRWEIFLVVKKTQGSSTNCTVQLLGFATLYCFYHYPDSSRLRISQILVLPPYQNQGHGRHILEAVNSVAVSENIYDITIEEPSDYLQYLRACIDTCRLLTFEPIKPAIDAVVSSLKERNLSKTNCKSSMSPPSTAIEIARQKLKINKKQFLRCWEVLIYLTLDPQNSRCMNNFRACISDRMKSDILDKDAQSSGKRLIEVPNDYGLDTTFVVFWSMANGEVDSLAGMLEGDQPTQEHQLNILVDTQIEEITDIARKVSLLCNTEEGKMRHF
ncbi:probable histone acetyltransferase type B catalytic subunit [Typha latifolia]|uniref:probable histone acetyltransferase type B catalytic subunit n=1 Tax=Typha latifolia TaxID=4733 RepID=UPI003C2B58FA